MRIEPITLTGRAVRLGAGVVALLSGGAENGRAQSALACGDSAHWRDTVYFSILDSEWPGVKANLEHMLGQK
jgi:hypothetical protein